ncbi:MAG: PKD domain-containing protein, partial [Bacteroidota bacterium]
MELDPPTSLATRIMIRGKHVLPFLLCFVFSGWATLLAQPGNVCESAIPITNVIDFCSGPNGFSNVSYNAAPFTAPDCFQDASNDMWFSFEAIATDVVITVNGASGPGGGGTLQNPEVALLLGDCAGPISTIQCQTSSSNNNFVELNRGSLVPGQTYLFRIDGANSTGSFELCVNNFSPPADTSSDCMTASLLCDTSPFSVQQVVGGGFDNDEAGDTCLDFPFDDPDAPTESSSAWYTWIADNNGLLEFTLVPNNPGDDLDFIVYELPNGVGDCSDKIPIRCMASGDFEFPSPCMGPTGLRIGSTDEVETIGCEEPGKDNFLAPIQQVTGQAYALLINNFTNTGGGFNISFGGDAEFFGPEADFVSSEEVICAGEIITFTNTSTPGTGNLINYVWVFGAGSVPNSAVGPGPHTVTYNRPGDITVALTIESTLGCVISEFKQGFITVEPCCETRNEISVTSTNTDLDCAEDTDGIIDVTAVSNFPPSDQLKSNGG